MQHLATLFVMWTLRHSRTRLLTVEKVCETLTAVKGGSLVEKLAATLAEMKAKAVNKTLGDVEAEELDERLANALLDVVAEKNATH